MKDLVPRIGFILLLCLLSIAIFTQSGSATDAQDTEIMEMFLLNEQLEKNDVDILESPESNHYAPEPTHEVTRKFIYVLSGSSFVLGILMGIMLRRSHARRKSN